MKLILRSFFNFNSYLATFLFSLLGRLICQVITLWFIINKARNFQEAEKAKEVLTKFFLPSFDPFACVSLFGVITLQDC